jgi:hypothetical protein
VKFYEVQFEAGCALDTVFELIIVVSITARFSAAPVLRAAILLIFYIFLGDSSEKKKGIF